MPDELAQVAWVTGASRGIGRLLAVHLARSGAAVVALARGTRELESLVAEVGDAALITVSVDVRDQVAARTALDAAAEQVGPPTLVIACAGTIDALGPVADADPDRWWSAVAVDLYGTMSTAHTALRWMLPAGSGRIVTVYGNLGDRGQPNLSAFAVAKAGIARFTETLAEELDGSGVIALGVHPGFVRSPMTEHLAWSDEGRRWLPDFGGHAVAHWGDGAGAIELIDQIASGAADRLAGRIIRVGDDLADLARRAAGNEEFRRLRLDLTD